MSAVLGRLRRKWLVRTAVRQYRVAYCRARDQQRTQAARLAGILGLIVGLALLSLPVIANVITQAHSQQSISQAQSTYDPTADPAIRAVMTQAHRYNASLTGKHTKGTVLPYKKQLEYGGNSSNAWIEIPAIGVNLPIYKGTSEEALAAGVGHLEGSSLPVGGTPSNCVLTAHSGMPNARMFDDIRNLNVGDRVAVHTLGTPFAYEVESSEVVLPDQTAHLEIYRADEDMLTLVTCTPYGVNDHRLLVHCKRIAYNPDDFQDQPLNPARLDRRNLPLIIALIVMATVGITLAVRKRFKKEKIMSLFSRNTLRTLEHQNRLKERPFDVDIGRATGSTMRGHAQNAALRLLDEFVSDFTRVMSHRAAYRLIRAQRNIVHTIETVLIILLLGCIGLAVSSTQAWADQTLAIHDHDVCSGLDDVGDAWFSWPNRMCTQWSHDGTERAHGTRVAAWLPPGDNKKVWIMGKATTTGDLAVVQAPQATQQCTGIAERTEALWGIVVNRELAFNDVNEISGTVTINWDDIAKDPYGTYYDMRMTVSDIRVRPHTESSMEKTSAGSVLILNSTKYGCNATASFCGTDMITQIGEIYADKKQRSFVSVSMEITVELLQNNGATETNRTPISKDETKTMVAAFRDLDGQVSDADDPDGEWSESVTLRSGFIGPTVHAGKPAAVTVGSSTATAALRQQGARYYGAQTVNGKHVQTSTAAQEDATGFAVKAYANGYRFKWAGDHCGTKLFDEAGGQEPNPQDIALTMGKTLDGTAATKASMFAFKATATHTGNGTAITTTAKNNKQGKVCFTFPAVMVGTYRVNIAETTEGYYAVPCGTAMITVDSDGDGGIQASNTSWEGDDTFKNYRYAKTALKVKKALVATSGTEKPDITEAFLFRLRAANDQAEQQSALPDAVTVQNPKKTGGTATFGKITLKEPGTYVYTVSEEGSVDFVTNDTHADGEKVTVTVALVDNKLTVTDIQAADKSNRLKNGVKFTNTYIPPVEMPFTGAGGTPWQLIVGGFAAIIGGIALLATRTIRRSSQVGHKR